MRNRRIVSVNSREGIYHFEGCRYANKMLPKYQMEMSHHQAEQLGFRPCKCCNTMRFRLHREERAINNYVKGKKMRLKLQGEVLCILTEIGLWKIVYRKREQEFFLYHGNSSAEQVDFGYPELEKYHRQGDLKPTHSLLSCLDYLYRHDLFRKAEKEAGGNLKDIKVDKKYEKSVARRNRRNQVKRVDSLFCLIENGNEEFRKLSFC